MRVVKFIFIIWYLSPFGKLLFLTPKDFCAKLDLIKVVNVLLVEEKGQCNTTRVHTTGKVIYHRQ